MILNFKYGFMYGGIPYGWSGNYLYRLPYTNKSKMHYGLKKMDSIMVGCKPGYQVAGVRKTTDQLWEITIIINMEISIISDKENPF